MGVAPCVGLLLLIGHIIQQGALPGLLPPQNVTLASENCRPFLTWQPAPDSTNSTQYEVERLNESEWIKETPCRGNNLRQTQRCELYLSNLHTHYQARVRAHDGTSLSGWAYSNSLQLYRDTVIGPLNLSLAAADSNLTVVVSMPHGAPEKMCPYLSVLKIQISLTEEGDNNQPIKSEARRNLTKYTFEDLKPNTKYCVHIEVLNQPAKKAIQCITMPSGPAGDYWVLFILGSVTTIGMTLLGAVGILFFRRYLQPSEIDFPASLRFRNHKPNGSCLAWRPILEEADLLLEESSIASLSTVMLPPNATPEQKTLLTPLIPSGYRVWGLSDYCANGFDQGNLNSMEDTSSWSVAGVESLSSREPMRDDDPADGCYQITLGLLDSSASPSPSSPRLHLYSRSGSSWDLKHKTGSNGGGTRLPPLFGAISLNSLKLQAVLDVYSPVCSPRACVVMQDYSAQPEAPSQKATQVCLSQPGFPEDPTLQSDSNLEAKGTKGMTFSSYESRQPILSCEHWVKKETGKH